MIDWYVNCKADRLLEQVDIEVCVKVRGTEAKSSKWLVAKQC